MDEVELTKRQTRGARAYELLENETLKQVFAELHDDYLWAWKQTRARDTDARERLWQAIQILGKVQDHLRKLFDDGKIATKDLARIKYLKR